MYLLTAERDESGSSEGSLHGHVCEINTRPVGTGRRRSMENVVVSLLSVVMASGESVAKLVAKARGGEEHV